MDFYSLGIVSDTHDAVDSIQVALNAFKQYGVDRVVHCGDITSPETVRYFSGFNTTFVLGNNDRRAEIADAVSEIGGILQEQPVCIDWHGKRVFLVHGHESGASLAENAFASGDWDLVCIGHSHVPFLRRSEKTIFLNPGALENGDFSILTASGAVRQLNVEDCE